MKYRAPKLMNGMTIFAALAVLTDLADAQKIPAPHTGALRWPVVRPGGQSSFRALGNVKDNVRYSLTDIGMLAGEQSSFLPISESVDSSGVLAGLARPMASTITDRSSDSRSVSAAHRPARGQPIQFSGHRKHKAT